MYLGFRQYQLHFDLAGLGVLCAALVVLGALIWQITCWRRTTSIASVSILLALCSLQFYRGWMVPDSAWLTMLGAIETSNQPERSQRIQQFVQYWDVNAETMRAIDWFAISTRWNVCHSLWSQAECVNPTPSENAVGVARELLNSMAVSSRQSRSAQ